MDYKKQNEMLKEELKLLIDLNHALEKQVRHYESRCDDQCAGKVHSRMYLSKTKHR